jgi:hypothetical protein
MGVCICIGVCACAAAAAAAGVASLFAYMHDEINTIMEANSADEKQISDGTIYVKGIYLTPK